jgi:hypothetical protein
VPHTAALFPFSKNCFVVNDGGYYSGKMSLSSLNDNINPTQARAIEHVVFEQERIFPDLTKGDIWTQLSGLKTLSVILQLGLLSDTGAHPNTPYGSVAFKESQKLMFTSAQVGVEFGLPPHLRGSSMAPTVQDIRAWQRRMEDALLGLRGKAKVTKERQIAEKAKKELEDEAEKERRTTVRSTRGLRNL